MIMDYPKKNHLINLIDMLVYDETVKLVYEDIQLKLTLDLVMFLIEDFLLYLAVSYLLSHRIYENKSDYYDYWLALVANRLKSLCQKNI